MGNNFYNQNNKQPVESYVGAPYNFVSLSDTVYSPYKKLISHAEMNDELLNGEIEYTITAETPIFVDSGRKNGDKSIGAFHRNGYGKFSIPGSTMRGLIRNNVQILGLSSVGEDIDDYSLMYRKVGAAGYDPAKNSYEKYFKTVSKTLENGKSVNVLKDVRAGYIQKQGDAYYIYKTESELENMNYYIVREKTIVDAYLKAKEEGKTSFAYDFFAEKNNMQNMIGVEYEEVFERQSKKNVLRGKKNVEYVPYFAEVCYSVSASNSRYISRIKEATEENCLTMKKGYVMSTGFMDGKQVLYVIPEIDESKEAIKIPDNDLKYFQIDYNKRETKLGDKYDKDRDAAKKKFFALPEEGVIKPVFYIDLYQERNKKDVEEHIYFGFTPRLRIFYDYTIAHGVKTAHRYSNDRLDYAKVLFGYTGDDKKDSAIAQNYKGRLSFGDAVVEGNVKEMDKVILTLGSPSPTSYYDYLTLSDKMDKFGNSIPYTYNDPEFEIRGVKQYWLHDGIVRSDATESKMSTVMRPLPKNTQFKGKIRFKNLTKDELGLLLWSVRLEKNSAMNVGKAKSYGYGRIKVSNVTCNIMDLEKAYNASDMIYFMNPFQSVDIDETIAYYKKRLKEQGKIDIDRLKSVKEFFAMKNCNNLPDKKDRHYMALKDYRNRKGRALPTVEEVLNKKK